MIKAMKKIFIAAEKITELIKKKPLVVHQMTLYKSILHAELSELG